MSGEPSADEQAPLTVLTACSANSYAQEISKINRGLFSLAFETAFDNCVKDGVGVVLDAKFVEAVRDQMEILAREFELDGSQNPNISHTGAAPILVSPQEGFRPARSQSRRTVKYIHSTSHIRLIASVCVFALLAVCFFLARRAQLIGHPGLDEELRQVRALTETNTLADVENLERSFAGWFSAASMSDAATVKGELRKARQHILDRNAMQEYVVARARINALPASAGIEGFKALERELAPYLAKAGLGYKAQIEIGLNEKRTELEDFRKSQRREAARSRITSLDDDASLEALSALQAEIEKYLENADDPDAKEIRPLLQVKSQAIKRSWFLRQKQQALTRVSQIQVTAGVDERKKLLDDLKGFLDGAPPRDRDDVYEAISKKNVEAVQWLKERKQESDSRRRTRALAAIAQFPNDGTLAALDDAVVRFHIEDLPLEDRGPVTNALATKRAGLIAYSQHRVKLDAFNRIDALSSFGPVSNLTLLAREVEAKPGLTPADIAEIEQKLSAKRREMLRDRRYTNCLQMPFRAVPKTEVLFSIWLVRESDLRLFRTARGATDSVSVIKTPDLPAANVSWREAGEFCEWLTELERSKGSIGPPQYYRLPSDSEWSWAAGIGAEEAAAGASRTPQQKDGDVAARFPWGTAWPPPSGAGNYLDESVKAAIPAAEPIPGYDDGFLQRSPVAAFHPNQFGLFDMGGNLWQYCLDPFDGVTANRVARGGSYLEGSRAALLSSARRPVDPDARDATHGFRIVLAGPVEW